MIKAARKRPLCVLCMLLMLLIPAARAADLPIFGEPPDSEVLRSVTEEGQTVRIAGTVSERTAKTNSVQYILTNSYLLSENTEIPLNKITMFSKKEADLTCGSLILVSGTLSVPEKASNPGQFDFREYYAAQKIYYSLSADSVTVLKEGTGFREILLRQRSAFVTRLEAMTDADTAEVLKAVLLGDRTGLDADSKRSWQAGGILHILAISGVKILFLVSLLPAKKPVKWAFLQLHIVQKYIFFLCVNRIVFIACPSWFLGGKIPDIQISKRIHYLA